MDSLNESGKLIQWGDHDYGSRGELPPEPTKEETPVLVENIASNVTVSTDIGQSENISWNEGRRVVELEVLAEQLFCNKCNTPLHLKDIHKKTFQQVKAAVLEGETYQPQIEENVSVRDIETIPTKYSLEGIDNYVVFDLETTGLSRTSDITQISAYDGTNMLNLYVSPRQSISSKASDVTEKSRPVLVGHNIHSYDVPVLRNLLREFNLLSSFDNLIYGCIDTLKIAKREIPKADVQNYKQQTLVQKFLEIVYDAHNSEEDVRSLYKLFHLKLKQTCSGKDLFPFNYLSIVEGFSSVIVKKVISKDTARKLSCTGLSLHHLELAYKRNNDDGVKSIMQDEFRDPSLEDVI
ncbi:unnamed protein product [Mytilus edulis]|uniref:Exonuclease domain-containing protein n=1 Tax=Mytilus edulis TaxID=6550 RepID=A0A8S3R693_MYTED|nr:unnamed protein product [Mytilus edulis]